MMVMECEWCGSEVPVGESEVVETPYGNVSVCGCVGGFDG
jgi:hypothetical protein